jgi:hypothetical protein
MKKVMKSFMAMALGLSLVLTGCSKDEDDAKNYAKDIAGKYVGTLELYQQVVGQDVEINVTEKNKTTAELSLNTTLYSLPSIGDLPLNVKCDANVAKSGDNYTVAGETSITLPNSDEPQTVTVTGGITSEGQATLNIGINLGTQITVVFSGTKQ